MSGLANRLVEAAAEGARRERIRSLRDTGRSATDNAQAAQSVILVLRELAKGTFLLRPDSPGTSGFVTAGEVRVELDRLVDVLLRGGNDTE